MKNNKVRMNISREMHEWFTGIEGKTNDERMRRVIETNDDYKKLLSDKYEIESKYIVLESMNADRIYLIQDLNRKVHTLKSLLVSSVTASIISVAYLAYAQGWFV